MHIVGARLLMYVAIGAATVGLFSAAPARASGFLVQGAVVTSVTNVASNAAAFAIYFTGGTGLCASGQLVVFPQTAAVDADSFKRAYTAALLAAVTKAPFDAYDYGTTATCYNGSFIEVYP